MRFEKIASLLAAVAVLAGVAGAPPERAIAAEGLAFTPPARATPFPSERIAVLTPKLQGSFFTAAHAPHPARSVARDLEKIVTAKGFTSAGRFRDGAALSDKQRESTSLLLTSSFDLSRAAGGAAGGTVTLTFLAPDDNAVMWTKKIAVAADAGPAAVQYRAMMRTVWDQVSALDLRILAIKLVGD